MKNKIYTTVFFSILLLLSVTHAQAATITDVYDCDASGNGGANNSDPTGGFLPTVNDGINCYNDLNVNGASHICTLRQAIIVANTDINTYNCNVTSGVLTAGGDDTIIFNQAGHTGGTGIVTLTESGADDAAAKGDLDITGNLTIIANQTGDSSQVATIDASALSTRDRIFHVLNGKSLTLENFVLTGGALNGNLGTKPYGGCVYVESGGSIDISNVEITACSLTATSTAGVVVRGAGLAVDAGTAITIIDSKIHDNQIDVTAVGKHAQGGGAYLSTGSGKNIDIDNSSFSNNTLIALPTYTTFSVSGGGLYVRSNLGAVTLQNTSIVSNTISGGGTVSTAGNNGGGLYFAGTSSLNLSNAAVSSNTAGVSGDSSPSYGGGLYLIGSGTTARFTDTLISGNVLSTSTLGSAQGAGVYVYGGGTATLTCNRCSIYDNDAINGLGGGFYVRSNNGVNTETIYLNNTLVADNTADVSGAGIELSLFSKLRASFTNITGNGPYAATAITGGGININQTADPRSLTVVSLFNSIVGNNTAGTGTGADVKGKIYLLSHSVLESTADTTITTNTASLTGSDPLVATRAFVSGPVIGVDGSVDMNFSDKFFTQEILNGVGLAASPARNLATCTDYAGSAVTVDLIGLTRPSGTGALCDAGVSEVTGICGDSVTDSSLAGGIETCDDGDTDDGDGCSSSCQTETTWHKDTDGDGYTTTDTLSSYGQPTGYLAAASSSLDCDDSNAAIYPGNTEITGDNIDQNCDGGEVCYVDADDDGYAEDSGTTLVSTDADCNDSGEAISTDPRTDCGDSLGAVHPGATETCATVVDDNCDGNTNDTLEATTVWYQDSDGDTYGNLAVTSMTCPGAAAPLGYVSNSNDCDDTNAVITVASAVWYQDGDTDGYGNVTISQTACTQPSGYVSNSDDCNDSNSSVYPGVAEVVADGRDENCDGTETCYVDADSDGFRTIDTSLTVVSSDTDCADSGEALESKPATDCNDANAAFNPLATETCGGGIDNNCDGSISSDDSDGDGFLGCDAGTGNAVDCDDNDVNVNRDASETCGDGVDNDCSGSDATCPTDSTNPTDTPVTTDTDSDGVSDASDAFPNDATESVDTDGDGIGNNADTDDNGDGVPDTDDLGGTTPATTSPTSSGGGCSLTTAESSVPGFSFLLFMLPALGLVMMRKKKCLL